MALSTFSRSNAVKRPRISFPAHQRRLYHKLGPSWAAQKKRGCCDGGLRQAMLQHLWGGRCSPLAGARRRVAHWVGEDPPEKLRQMSTTIRHSSSTTLTCHQDPLKTPLGGPCRLPGPTLTVMGQVSALACSCFERCISCACLAPEARRQVAFLSTASSWACGSGFVRMRGVRPALGVLQRRLGAGDFGALPRTARRPRGDADLKETAQVRCKDFVGRSLN